MSKEYFTDTEYRLLLSALDREMKVCKEVEKDNDNHICTDAVRSMTQKIKKIQHSGAVLERIEEELEDMRTRLDHGLAVDNALEQAIEIVRKVGAE